MFGADRMLLESVIAARDAGFRCVVTVPEHGPLVAALTEAGATVLIAPSLVLRKAMLRPRGWAALASGALRGAASAWRLLGQIRPACVVVNTITIPLWPLIAALRGVPSISHVHEAEASGSTAINRVLYAPHLASRRVLVNSRFALETMARSLPSLARRARIVYNGVTAPLDPSPPRPEPTAPLRVLFVGRLSPRKGPDVLIEAARLLRDAGTALRVDILGSAFAGYEWFEADLRRAVDEAALQDVVELHGYCDSIWPHLDRADVLVVPSTIDEPFGNTAVEGILALRPVIASDTSGLREAAGGYATARLAAPGDAVALAAEIAAIAADWPRLVADVAGSRRRALERHGPEAYRTAIGEHLVSLLPDAAAPQARDRALDAA